MCLASFATLPDVNPEMFWIIRELEGEINHRRTWSFPPTPSSPNNTPALARAQPGSVGRDFWEETCRHFCQGGLPTTPTKWLDFGNHAATVTFVWINTSLVIPYCGWITRFNDVRIPVTLHPHLPRSFLIILRPQAHVGTLEFSQDS